MDRVFDNLFKNFSSYKSSNPVELEIVMSLIRGCEYQGLVPFASAFISENKTDEEGSSKAKSKGSKPKTFVQVIGFVQRKWMQRDIEGSDEYKKVYNTM